MLINNVPHNFSRDKNKNSFKGFLELSAGVQNNMVLNRGLLNASSTLPWSIFANSKEERIELLRNNLTFITLAFIAPILNVPLANRISMRVCGLTKGLSDNNHKAIQLSNKYLVSDEKMLEGLRKYNALKENGHDKISERFFSSPLEKLFKKIKRKKLNDTVNIQELLNKCNGNITKLRKKLSRAKNITLCSDLIITCASLGLFIVVNNELTKKKTGRTGYSAEFNMANQNIVEERAQKYEKTKKRNLKILLTEIALISSIVPITIHKGLTAKNKNIFSNFIKRYAKLTDYTKGIYMSLFTTILGLTTNVTSLFLFSRNKTERNNTAIRVGCVLPVMLGGDFLITSLLANGCDKLFKTDLTVNNNKKTLLARIFPKYKSLETIRKEFLENKISSKTKFFANGIYWLGMVSCAIALATVIPSLCNKLTKQDVTEYVKGKNNKKQKMNNIFEEFNKFVNMKTRSIIATK